MDIILESMNSRRIVSFFLSPPPPSLPPRRLLENLFMDLDSPDSLHTDHRVGSLADRLPDERVRLSILKTLRL